MGLNGGVGERYLQVRAQYLSALFASKYQEARIKLKKNSLEKEEWNPQLNCSS